MLSIGAFKILFNFHELLVITRVVVGNRTIIFYEIFCYYFHTDVYSGYTLIIFFPQPTNLQKMTLKTSTLINGKSI